MGLFRDARKLTALSREIQKDWDPVAHVKAASAQMGQMAQQTNVHGSSTSVSALATVSAVHETGTMINNVAMYVADVTVLPDGGAPFIGTLPARGATALALIQPGRTIRVRYEPDDPATLVLDDGA